MDAEEIHLEEGEISDDSDNNYTPLERPANYSALQQQPRLPSNPVSESEEELLLGSSDSDSDSDPNVQKSKKPKMKLNPKPRHLISQHKKYDVWSNRVQEDVLAETLNSCDVTKKDRTRNVETYDYLLGRQLYEKSNNLSNKRNRQDRNNVNFRRRKRSNSTEKVKGKKRVILDLTMDVNSSAEDLAKDMANKLCEEKEDLILKVVNTMGKQKTMDIFKETQKIEEEGGMLILNQTRRRTPGGVFLYLVRHDYHITPDQRQSIFDDERQRSKQISRKNQKAKNMRLKCQIAAAKSQILPDLLTRAELLASQNPARKVKDESEETVVVNPPPTPETDGHENSGDGLDEPSFPTVSAPNSFEKTHGKLDSYEDDFLSLNCANDMDMF